MGFLAFKSSLHSQRSGLLLVALVAIGVLLGGASPPPRASAAVFGPFNASADAFTNKKDATTNYGTLTYIGVNGPGSRTENSYLRFDVTGVPAGARIRSATLLLYAVSGSPAGLSVNQVSSSWAETTITWRNAPSPGSVVASSGPVATSTSIALDVTPAVSGNGTVSFALTTSGATELQLASRERGGSLGPQLSIQTADAPVNSSPPSISGTAQAGQVLTAAAGSWSGTQPISYGYQWRRCDSAGANCADIASATGQTYTLASADVGSTARVAVTATNTGGSGSAGSAQTAVVAAAPAPPVNGSPPTISGTAQAGQVLTAAAGSWRGTQPISYGYQWRRCDSAGASCVDIVGAGAQTYTLNSADVGLTVRVAVTATNTVGSGSAGSAQTAVVAAAPAPPVNGSPPSISGTAQAGQVLTAAAGSWTGTQPISYGYQWRRCDSAGANCVDIVGATAQTYTLARRMSARPPVSA